MSEQAAGIVGKPVRPMIAAFGYVSRNLASIEISEQIQDEDVSICVSVQRGLRSGAYDTGRLSVRREAGEQLFHRLLHADLQRGLAASL